MNLGMPEIMIILVIALIVFGPRKLPELGKTLGKTMAQFRRASEDFKRTWEQEVELEQSKSKPSEVASSSYNSESNYYNPPHEDGHYNYASETKDSSASGEHQTTSDHSGTTPVTTPASQSAPTQRTERWI